MKQTRNTDPGRRREEELKGLIAETSTRFISLLPDSIDGGVELALEQAGRFFEADTARVYLFAPDRREFRLVYRWDSGAAAGLDGQAPAVSNASYPWSLKQLLARKPVVVPRVSELGAEAASEKARLESLRIASGVALSLVFQNEVIGIFVMASTRESDWSPEEIAMLEIVVQLLTNVIQRKFMDDELRGALEEVARLKEQLEAENVYLREEIAQSHDFTELVGENPRFLGLLRRVEQVAPSDASVLILGETGTGKELVARAIHGRSTRADRPLVKVNCAALPTTLIESELFGHERGAFTGAMARRIGRFELADRGTILLDEIGDLAVELQAKLLRVLQEGEFERLGSAQPIRVDVRVIAATNRDLEQAVMHGAFRADLYYRLSVFPLEVPPLRDRRDDIPLLARHFLAKCQKKLRKNFDHIPRDVMQALRSADWPGNVRELANLIERAVIVSTGPTLQIDEFPGRVEPVPTASSKTSLDEMQRSHILRVVEACGWRIRGRGNAADRLGLNPSTLRSRMKKLGIERPADGSRLATAPRSAGDSRTLVPKG